MVKKGNRSSRQCDNISRGHFVLPQAATLVALLLGTLVLSLAAGATPLPGHNTTAGAFRSSPVMFIENVGQFDETARFKVWGGPGTMWLAEDAIWITVLERPHPSPGPSDHPLPGVWPFRGGG